MHNALILHYQESLQNDKDPGLEVSLSEREFAAQMALIEKLRMPVVSLRELVENDRKRKRWHRHVVVITCTDTFVTRNPTVLPLWEHYGFPVTVFVATREQQHAECWAQWRQIAAAGLSLGSHTVSKPDLTALPEAEMRLELADSKTMMEAETGQPVKFLLPPLGRYNKKVIRAAQELGYDAMLSNKIGYNKFNADLYQLKCWTVPANASLHAFKRMLCRDKKELLAQKLKTETLKTGKKLLRKNPFKKLKRLFRKVKV